MNHSSEEYIGMHRFERGGFVQALAKIGGDGEFERREVVVELRQAAGAQNGGRDARLRDRPLNGHLRGRFSELLARAQQDFQDAPVVLGEFVERAALGEASVAGSGVALALVFAGEEAAAERAPGTDADSQLLRGRDVLALDIALDQRVFQLQRGDAFLALLLGERVRARHIPGGSIGEAVVADLAGAHQIGERRDHFFHRRHGVPGVQPVQIDEIGIQPCEATRRWRGRCSCVRCRPNWDCRASR